MEPGTQPHLNPEERAGILDAIGQAVIATDTDGRVTYWNAAAQLLYGWTAEEALGRNIAELTVPDVGQQLGAEIMGRLSAGESWTGSFTVQRKDGGTFTALVTDSPILDDAGQVQAVVGVSVNLGDLLRPLLAKTREVVVVTTEQGTIHFASPTIEAVLGWSEEALSGAPLLALVHPSDRVLVEQINSVADVEGSAPALTFRMADPGGGWRWVEAIVADLRHDPAIHGLVWTLRDVSTRQEELDHLSALALHDPLTGLPNRLLLSDRISQLSARREAHGALLFIDLDDFKSINDTLGHDAGDALLRIVAARLLQVVRPEDSCGRWSGDEFIVLAESVRDLASAHDLAERVAAAISAPAVVADTPLQVRASVGVAMIAGLHDPRIIIDLADRAMYRVKQEHHRQR